MQKRRNKSNLIQIQNQALLDRLKGDEKIGIDEDGRVYLIQDESKIQALFREISSFFRKKEKSEIALKWAVHRFHQEKKYQPALNRLLKLHLISAHQTQDVIFQWYAVRLEELVNQGFKYDVAAAIVTMEMNCDRLISEDYKKVIAPEKLGSSSWLLKDMHGKPVGVFKPDIQNETYIIAEGGVDSVPYSVPISIPFPQKPGEKRAGVFQEFYKGRALLEMSDEEIAAIEDEEVQRVALLDLMLENEYRGRENLLYTHSNHLHSLGHGRPFSDHVNSVCFFWPQIEKPLSERLKSQLFNYPLESQCEKLKLISPDVAKRHKERILFLQNAVNQNPTLESLIHVFV